MLWRGILQKGDGGPGPKYDGPGRALRMDGPGIVFDGLKRALNKKKNTAFRAIEKNKKYTKFNFSISSTI